jgi:3-oxoacyl-[acyl-carrier-protein] synthase I
MPTELHITAIGAATPVGAGADQTCASIRAGLSGFTRHPWFYPRTAVPVIEPPERVVCGITDDFTVSSRGQRVLSLTAAALRDLVNSAGLTRRDAESIPVIIYVGGSERAEANALAGERFTQLLAQKLGLALQAELVTGDQTSVLCGLTKSRAIVVGVDTLVDDDSLAWFDARDRLRSERIADGFLAGEAAACVLVEPAARRRAKHALARVRGIGQGSEANVIGGEKNSTARGLCDAIRAATRDMPAPSAPWAVCDMTGESYWAYEWGVARARMPQLLGATDLWHPADCMGAVGAAASALALVVAARALARGYAPAKSALIWCGSDAERRAACLLEASE